MKHQLFRKNRIVQINVGEPHLIVVGKVKDSEISIVAIRRSDIFNTPEEAIEIESNLMLIYENPEKEPTLVTNSQILLELCECEEFAGLEWRNDRLYVAIRNLEIPSDEIKDLFYNLNQRAK